MESQQFQPALIPKGVNSGQAQHLRSIDSKIRKQWNQLYCCRKNNVQTHETGIHINKIRTEPSEYTPKPNAHEVQFLKSNKNREVTFQRIRKHNDIFFRKKRNEPHSTSHLKYSSTSPNKISEFVLQEQRKNESNLSKKEKEVKLPLMLQKRGKKLLKQMSIIEYMSGEDLRKIQEKESLKMQLNRQDQDKLISRMKGTKLYYKFVQEWKTPLYLDNPHSNSTKL